MSHDISHNLTLWAVDEFNDTACAVELLDHMRQHASVKPDDPALIERLGLHTDADPDPELIGEHLDRLAGTADSHWTTADFLTDGESHDRTDDMDCEDDHYARVGRNVSRLTEEFVGHAIRRHSVAPTRAEIARHELHRYILTRLDGDLDDRRSMFERMTNPRKKIPAAVDSPDFHPLCPDRDTLDCFLAGRLDFMGPQPYKVAALFELIPLWLTFVESRGLLSPERRRQATDELTPLADDASPLIGTYTDDQAVAEEVMQHWKPQAAS